MVDHNRRITARHVHHIKALAADAAQMSLVKTCDAACSVAVVNRDVGHESGESAYLLHHADNDGVNKTVGDSGFF